MKNRKIKKTDVIKLAEKKLKKSNKWLKEFKDYDVAHQDGTYKSVKKTKKFCEKILWFEYDCLGVEYK